MADKKAIVLDDSGMVRNSATGDVVVVPGLKDSALTSTYVVFAGTDGVLSGSANLTFDGTVLYTTELSINTSGDDSILVSTYHAISSAGHNIWIGNGGTFTVGGGDLDINGSWNISIGFDTLKNLTTGHENVAVGAGTMRDATSAYVNVALGGAALRANLTGNGNVAVGANTLLVGTAPTNNVAIGQDALLWNNGTGTVAVGYFAGYFNTGSGSVFLGNFAGFYETGSNKLFIDNTTRVSEADARLKALIYGLFASTADNQDLVVNGQLGLNITPTAWVTLPAGIATAGHAPLKFASGISLATAETGAIEFTTDDLYFTITTGAARKGFIFNDGTNLTSGKIPVASTNGRLIDGPTDASSNWNTAFGWGNWSHTTLSGYGITDACPLAHKTTEDALNGLVKCNGSGTYSAVDLIPRIVLPNDFTAVVDDELQLFLRGIIEAQNPYDLPYTIICSVGSSYPRYFDYTAVSGDVGTKTITVSVLDLDNVTLATTTANLIVVNHTAQPAANKNVLCIGDSLTNGTWTAEFYRRLTQAGGTPAGLSYSNITFIGDIPVPGYITQGYTGWSGWSYTDFIGTTRTTDGQVIFPDTTCDKTKVDVGSIWSDANGSTWILSEVSTRYQLDTTQLVTNPGFETLGANPPVWANWGQYYSTGALANETTLVHSGSNAVKLTRGSAGGADPFIYQLSIPVTAGQLYELSFWTRGNGSQAGAYSLYDETNATYIDTSVSTGISGTIYTKFIRQFTAPVGCTHVRIYCLTAGPTGSIVYFDDVSLRKKISGLVPKIVLNTGTNTLPVEGTLTHVSGGTHAANIVYYKGTPLEPITPFWNSITGQLSFSDWASKTSNSPVDAIYILLGWNGLSINLPLATDHAAMIANVTTMVNQIHTDFPSAQVRLLGLQIPSVNGGFGAQAGASHGTEYYEWIRSIFGLNLAYQALPTTLGATSWLRFISISSQFDSENNMPQSSTVVNTRNAATEQRGTNAIHPATSGYYQIADAAYRDFIRTYCS